MFLGDIVFFAGVYLHNKIMLCSVYILTIHLYDIWSFVNLLDSNILMKNKTRSNTLSPIWIRCCHINTIGLLMNSIFNVRLDQVDENKVNNNTKKNKLRPTAFMIATIKPACYFTKKSYFAGLSISFKLATKQMNYLNPYMFNNVKKLHDSD